MAIEIVMIKGQHGHLVPATEDDADKLATMKMGQGVKVTITQFHNLRFHRKLFVLFRLAFDIWRPTAPVEYLGRELPKSFQQFREDLTILAGHYDPALRMDGSVRLNAKSLSFSRMADEEKLKIYRDVLTVVWERVLRHGNYKTPEEVESVVNQLIGFE